MFTDIITNVGILFVMMLPGIIMKKCRLATENFGKGVSNLVLYIAQPALIFMAYMQDYDERILINSVYVLLLAVVAHGIFAAGALLCFKKAPDGMKRMLRFATIFSNAAFMGIPLIKEVLEKDFPGATLYASIYNIVFNLVLWSLGVYLCTAGKDTDKDGISDHAEARQEGASISKALLHPVTIAAAIGLVFFITPLNSYVPDLATECLSKIADLVAPLAMVVIGLRLPDIDFKGIWRDGRMYLFLALRHVILPLIVVGVVRLVMLLPIGMDPAVGKVIVIMASAPAATSATMFAEKYGCDAPYISKLVAVSTLFSIATMPFITLLV